MGRVVGPALADERGVQFPGPVDSEVVEFASGGLFGPSGPAAADFNFVPGALHGEQADASFDQHGPFVGEFGPVRCSVEQQGGIGIFGELQDRAVA